MRGVCKISVESSVHPCLFESTKMLNALPRRLSSLHALSMTRRCLSSSSDSVIVTLSPQGTAEVTLNRYGDA